MTWKFLLSLAALTTIATGCVPSRDRSVPGDDASTVDVDPASHVDSAVPPLRIDAGVDAWTPMTDMNIGSDEGAPDASELDFGFDEGTPDADVPDLGAWDLGFDEGTVDSGVSHDAGFSMDAGPPADAGSAHDAASSVDASFGCTDDTECDSSQRCDTSNHTCQARCDDRACPLHFACDVEFGVCRRACSERTSPPSPASGPGPGHECTDETRYCYFPPGDCSSSGWSSGVCRSKSSAVDYHEPTGRVCGCDGVDYGSATSARAVGANVDTLGVCTLPLISTSTCGAGYVYVGSACYRAPRLCPEAPSAYGSFGYCAVHEHSLVNYYSYTGAHYCELRAIAGEYGGSIDVGRTDGDGHCINDCSSLGCDSSAPFCEWCGGHGYGCYDPPEHPSPCS